MATQLVFICGRPSPHLALLVRHRSHRFLGHRLSNLLLFSNIDYSVFTILSFDISILQFFEFNSRLLAPNNQQKGVWHQVTPWLTIASFESNAKPILMSYSTEDVISNDLWLDMCSPVGSNRDISRWERDHWSLINDLIQVHSSLQHSTGFFHTPILSLNLFVLLKIKKFFE